MVHTCQGFTHKCLKYVLGLKFDDLSGCKNWHILFAPCVNYLFYSSDREFGPDGITPTEHEIVYYKTCLACREQQDLCKVMYSKLHQNLRKQTSLCLWSKVFSSQIAGRSVQRNFLGRANFRIYITFYAIEYKVCFGHKQA